MIQSEHFSDEMEVDVFDIQDRSNINYIQAIQAGNNPFIDSH